MFSFLLQFLPVLIHHFFEKRTTVSDTELKTIAAKVLDLHAPRDWYYALMDYGNWLKAEGKSQLHRQKNYKKQKPFKGSERYVRGYLLKETLRHKTLKLSDVVLPGYENETILKVARDLVNEHLLAETSPGIISVV